MAIVAGDERLIAAHETTVRETLQEVEKYAATRVRLASLNENRTTGNWVMAAYTHDTSRELDPQPHTHAVAANLTYDGAEARWKTLQAFGLYERRSYLTEIYRNALAREVCALGYEIENRRHVAAKKSHSHGASKRQAHEDSCRAIHRAGRGTASYPEGADTDDGFRRRVHGPSSRRVARSQVERHRSSEDGDPCRSLDRHATRWRLQNGSLSQTRSTRFALGKGPVGLAAAKSLPYRRGLGFC
jgi:hypothetical protein